MAKSVAEWWTSQITEPKPYSVGQDVTDLQLALFKSQLYNEPAIQQGSATKLSSKEFKADIAALKTAIVSMITEHPKDRFSLEQQYELPRPISQKLREQGVSAERLEAIKAHSFNLPLDVSIERGTAQARVGRSAYRQIYPPLDTEG